MVNPMQKGRPKDGLYRLNDGTDSVPLRDYTTACHRIGAADHVWVLHTDERVVTRQGGDADGTVDIRLGEIAV